MANRVYHWKHGWIPLDHQAAARKWSPVMSKADAEAWAHDSKVKKTLYHGTLNPEGVREHGFDLSKAGSRSGDKGFSGEGIYLSPDPGYVKPYATPRGEFVPVEGGVLPVKVRLLNPWMSDGPRGMDTFVSGLDSSGPHSEVISRRAAAVRKEAERRGHDGVVVKYEGSIHEVVVFSPRSVVVIDENAPATP
jgi:hypothetical protein